MQGQIQLKDLIKNTFLHSSGIFIGKILNFSLKIVALKYLGLDVLGIYIILNLLTPYYSYFFIGLSYSLPRIIPALQAKKEFEKISQNRSVINIFNIFVSTILTLAFIIFIIFFYKENDYDFSKMNLIIIFGTAFFTQISTLINSHLKSIGEFTKKTVNSALVRIFLPALSILLIIFFGLNGYLFAALLINAINAISLIVFSVSRRLGIFNIEYFNFSLLKKNINLGFSMLISKKFSEILYTIMMTSIGVNFSKLIVGEVGFLMSMFNTISQLLGPLYLVVERRIYLLKEMGKIKTIDLLNISFIHAVILGGIMQFFSLFLILIIPIFFVELNNAMNIIPFCAILFTIKNSIVINDFYINAYNLLKQRNLIAILIFLTYFFIARNTDFELNVLYFLITYIICILLYKICMHLFSIKFFSSLKNIISIIIGDLLSAIVIFLGPFLIINLKMSILEAILLTFFFIILLLFSYFKNPMILLKNALRFLKQDL